PGQDQPLDRHLLRRRWPNPGARLGATRRAAGRRARGRQAVPADRGCGELSRCRAVASVRAGPRGDRQRPGRDDPVGRLERRAQWDALVPILVEGELLPYLDLAYQGFGDGIVEDAYALRALAAARDRAGRPLSFFVANSFSKSMSLYGERCGALSVVCADAGEAGNVLGQLKFTVRRNYSSPPIHGGQIVAAVLTHPALRRDWEAELTGMRERIRAMRQALHAVLAAKM